TRMAEFIRRAVATGTVLDSREERSVAQSLTNFWAKRLKASPRLDQVSKPRVSISYDPTSDTQSAQDRSPESGGTATAARPSLRRSDSALAPSDTALAGDSALAPTDSALAGDSTLAREPVRGTSEGCALIEDTLLAEYDAGSLGASAVAADRAIESMSAEYA